MKTIGLGIIIGGIFKGASAFTSAISSTTLLDNKIKKLDSRKLTLSNKFGAASKEVSKLDAKISKLRTNLSLIDKTDISLKNIEDYRSKFRASFMDKVALGGTIAMPFKFAIDFESAMADVKKVANFTNEKEAKQFEKSLLTLSRAIPLSATELASISASGGQLGIAKENLLEFTTTVAKMSTAFDMGADSAGENIAKLMNVYGLTQKEVVELGDGINHLSDTSASKARDIVEVLGRVGGVAKIFGLTTVQTGALSSAFLALGKQPEVAGTAINALLQKLSNVEGQNKSFQSGLASIGLSAKELKKSIENDAQGALIEFLKTLEKVPKSQQMGVLSDLFGAEYADDIALLVGGMENYTKALENTADKTKYLGSMNREFETRSKTTANNLTLLGNSVKSIAINFGSLLLPALNTIITPIRTVGSMVADFVAEFPVLSKTIGIVTVGAVALSIGFSAIGYMASFVIAGLLNVGKALLVVNSLLLANPIGLVVLAIGAAAFVVYKYWEPIKGFFVGLWGEIKNIFNTGITFIKDYLGWTPLGMVINNWTPLTSFFSSLWGGIKNIFSTSVDFISSVFGTIVDKVKKPFEVVFNWFVEKFQWLENKISTVVGPVSNFFSKVGSGLGGFFKDASQFFTLDGGYKKELKTVEKADKKTTINTVKPRTLSTSNIDNKRLNKNQNVTIQKIEINNPTSTVEVQKGVTSALLRSGVPLSDEEF